MDREAYHAAVHGIAKSQIGLSHWAELNMELNPTCLVAKTQDTKGKQYFNKFSKTFKMVHIKKKKKSSCPWPLREVLLYHPLLPLWHLLIPKLLNWGCPSFCCPSWSPVFAIPPPSSSCCFFPGLCFPLPALLTQSMILSRSQQPHGCPSIPICVLSPVPFLGSGPLLEDVSWIPY